MLFYMALDVQMAGWPVVCVSNSEDKAVSPALAYQPVERHVRRP